MNKKHLIINILKTVTVAMCLFLFSYTEKCDAPYSSNHACMVSLVKNNTGVKAGKSVGNSQKITTVEYSFDKINPLYEDILSAKEFKIEKTFSKFDAEKRNATDTTLYETVEEAGNSLREAMKNRIENVTVKYHLTDLDADIETLISEIFNEAIKHTGEPTEGDYIKYQYGGYHCSVSGDVISDYIDLSFEYEISYYSTKEEEEQVDAAVKEILGELKLDELTVFNKITVIYDYLRNTIEYDDFNINDDEYVLKYTAYGGLIDKKAICQGYSVALYRLLLEAGIDTRIISGIGVNDEEMETHGWNIIKFGYYYFNADVTWDSQTNENTYFMTCPDTFDLEHIRNDEYLTEEFEALYPMGNNDCDRIIASGCIETSDREAFPDDFFRNYVADEMDTDYDGLISESERNRSVSISIENDDIESLKGIELFKKIKILDVSAMRITFLNVGIFDEKAFVDLSGCSSLKRIVFKGNAPVFSDKCFSGTGNVTVYYPEDNETWTEDIKKAYGGIRVTWKEGDEKTAGEDEKNDFEPILVNRVVLNLSTLNICPSNTFKLEYFVLPVTATEQTVEWTTSDKNIVNINREGLVTAIGDGEAVITATSNDERKISEKCVVRVGHEEVEDPKVAATETTTGLTGGSHCSRCGKVLNEQKIIPVLSQLETKQPTPVLQSTPDPKTVKLKTPGKIVILSVKKYKKKNIRIKWKKQKNAESYHIELTTTIKKRKKTITGISRKTKFEVKGLKKKRKYYIRVRGVCALEGKILSGPWSKPYVIDNRAKAKK